MSVRLGMRSSAPAVRPCLAHAALVRRLAQHRLDEATNSGARSCGPGLASGWPWKLNAGRSVQAMPCSEPSNSERCVARTLAGSVASSTAKPWFWRVIITRPVSSSCTGWLAPWWPNFIFMVRAPTARPSNWWPRQMPNTGMSVVEELADRLDRVGRRAPDRRGRSRGRRRPGCSASTSSAGGLRRHHRHAAAVVGEQAQDVALDAEVVGHDVQALAGAAPRALLQRPDGALVPLVRLVGARRPWRGPCP